MKNNSTKSILLFFFTVSTVLVLSSCFPEATDPPSILQVPVQIDGIDSTFASGKDSLIVESVEMVHGKSFIRIDQDSIKPFTGLIRQLSFGIPPRNAVFNFIYRGGIPEGVYQGMTFKIITAADSIPNLDPEFTEGGQFSIIVEGTYNGSSFTFKSDSSFTYSFEFLPPITVPKTGQGYTFLISANVSSWFQENGAPGYYDPRNDANKNAINDNIAVSFTIEQLSP